MESQLIVKTPSILFPVTAKNSSFSNLFEISKNYKSWNDDEEKKSLVSLRLQRPRQLFNKNRVRANAAVPEYNFRGSDTTRKIKFTNEKFVDNKSMKSDELIVAPNSLQWESFRRNLDVFSRFARVNVMLARALSVTSVCLLTVQKISDISPLFLTAMLLVIVAGVSMHVYVGGLNQLCDIEIDKVNKPEYPLASGEYSVKTGVLIVVSAAIMALSIPVFVGSWPLFWGLLINFFILGFAYSVDLPLLRWKRSPLLTAISLLVCNTVLQIGYYLHMQTNVLGRPAIFSKSLLFIVAITGFFMVILGVFKDISDVAGDKLDDIKSLAILLGEKRVFMICVSLMEIAYVAAMILGATLSNPWSKYLTVIGHATMGLILWKRVQSFDYSGPAAYESFYKFMWKLFCAEYILVQFIR